MINSNVPSQQSTVRTMNVRGGGAKSLQTGHMKSAFQISLVTSVYIKIMNYIGIISAKVNKTMQTMQLPIKKNPYFNKNQIYEGLYFWWKDLQQKMFKMQPTKHIIRTSCVCETHMHPIIANFKGKTKMLQEQNKISFDLISRNVHIKYQSSSTHC